MKSISVNHLNEIFQCSAPTMNFLILGNKDNGALHQINKNLFIRGFIIFVDKYN
jgi:hypothetical protein